MSGAGGVDIWLLVGLGVVSVGVMLGGCRACLRLKLEAIRSLWDDIYHHIVERCTLTGDLAKCLRKRLRTDSKVADDIDYLLQRMAETSDPRTHAAVQNGLVLTVQTAVEQFHRDEGAGRDAEMSKAMESIGVVDSRLAPLRDRFNARVRQYNKLLNTLPFSLVASLGKVPERPLFPMLIPWWSTDPAAYGSVSARDIRQTLQSWRAPLILAPSQRTDWQGGPDRVIRVADRLLGKDRTGTNGRPPEGTPPAERVE